MSLRAQVIQTAEFAAFAAAVEHGLDRTAAKSLAKAVRRGMQSCLDARRFESDTALELQRLARERTVALEAYAEAAGITLSDAIRLCVEGVEPEEVAA